MYGFSVFLNEAINQKHIEEMVEAGFTGIFTSIHIPEDDDQQYISQLQELGNLAKKYDLSLVVDTSDDSLHKIGGSFENVQPIIDLGITGLRIDYGIEMEKVAKLTKALDIALNASTLTADDLDQLHAYHADFSHITAWHNYYPRPETGLGMENFSRQNQWLKSTGLRTMAFVPGDEQKRGPIYAGLPTIEAHRYMHPLAATLDLHTKGNVDDVYIGDPGITSETLFQFKHYIEKNSICIHLELADESTSEQIQLVLGDHTNRQDAAELVVRSQEARLRIKQAIDPVNTSLRNLGAVTIDNEQYGRYQGEVQICKTDLPQDGKVNVIGQVVKKDKELIAFIGSGQTFKLQMEDDSNGCRN